MAFTVAAADLYAHGAPESYFDGVPEASIAAALAKALGTCSRKLSPRVGGPASGWTFTDTAGREDCAGDVAIVAASALALAHGLTLPGEGADPQYAKRAEAVQELWSRMGTPGSKGTSARSGESEAEPLYAGLVDTTPDHEEGAPRGWADPPLYGEGAEL
jgi:hypothetical protein